MLRAIVDLQMAMAAPGEAALQDVIELDDATYPLGAFVQDAAGVWKASLSLTAEALGVDLAAS